MLGIWSEIEKRVGNSQSLPMRNTGGSGKTYDRRRWRDGDPLFSKRLLAHTALWDDSLCLTKSISCALKETQIGTTKREQKKCVLVKPIPNHLTRPHSTQLNALAAPSFGTIENGQSGPANLTLSCRAYHAFNFSYLVSIANSTSNECPRLQISREK